MIDLLTAVSIVAGVFFMLVASIGVLRLSDFYSRLHAPTKAATLGLVFLLVAVILHLGEAVVVTKAILAVVFIGATAPVGAHILGRAAYRTGVPASPETDPDEYRPHVARRGEPLDKPASDLDQDPSEASVSP